MIVTSMDTPSENNQRFFAETDSSSIRLCVPVVMSIGRTVRCGRLF
jgi:hypothetical protein